MAWFRTRSSAHWRTSSAWSVWRVVCAAALWLCSSVANAEAAPTVDWRAVTRTDIEAGYRLMRDSHPGMFDPGNRGFPKQLERARQRGLAFAARANTAAAYSASLGAFNSIINDGHARLLGQSSTSVQWPGFLTAWRKGGLRVYESAMSFPAKGDQLISCDGVTIDRLVERNVLSFAVHGGEARARWQLAPQALLDTGNPFVERPRRCVFRSSSGVLAHELVWSTIDAARLRSLSETSLNGDRLPVGLEERASGIFWVALPTFSPDAADRQAYDRLFDDLEAKRSAWRHGRALVLDLRHNEGGSSDWSMRTAIGLWSKGPVEQTMDLYFKGVQVWWRATADNASQLEEYARQSSDQNDTASANAFADLAAALRAAKDRGQAFFVEPFADTEGADAPTEVRLPVPIYVIVPAQCASACLDALDVFTRFPGVTLLGAPSATDSLYMDVRIAPLPSGRARAVLPMKMWVKRPRASGAAYRPSIEVTELDWSTTAFLARIEADLAARARPQ